MGRRWIFRSRFVSPSVRSSDSFSILRRPRRRYGSGTASFEGEVSRTWLSFRAEARNRTPPGRGPPGRDECDSSPPPALRAGSARNDNRVLLLSFGGNQFQLTANSASELGLTC